MVSWIGDVVDNAAYRIPPVKRALGPTQHLNTLNVVEATFSGCNTKVRRVYTVVVSTNARVTAQASEVTPDATDLNVPVRSGCCRYVVDHLVRTLNAHVHKEIFIHCRDGNRCVRYCGFDSITVNHNVFYTLGVRILLSPSRVKDQRTHKRRREYA